MDIPALKRIAEYFFLDCFGFLITLLTQHVQDKVQMWAIAVYMGLQKGLIINIYCNNI